jgi:hypothetical protein
MRCRMRFYRRQGRQEWQVLLQECLFVLHMSPILVLLLRVSLCHSLVPTKDGVKRHTCPILYFISTCNACRATVCGGFELFHSASLSEAIVD